MPKDETQKLSTIHSMPRKSEDEGLTVHKFEDCMSDLVKSEWFPNNDHSTKTIRISNLGELKSRSGVNLFSPGAQQQCGASVLQ